MRKPELFFDPDFVLDQSVNGFHACAFLGIGVSPLARLRKKGLIPAFGVESRIQGKIVWRYRVSDLYQFVEARRNRVRRPEPTPELSPALIAELLGVKIEDVYAQKGRGRLQGYTPKSVRAYIMGINRRKLVAEIRREFEERLSQARAESRRLRRLLSGSHRAEEILTKT